MEIDPKQLAEALSSQIIEFIKKHNTPTNEGKKILTLDELCEYLSVSPCWIYKKVLERKIPFFKNGKCLRFKKDEIDKWIDSKRVCVIPNS